MIGWFSLIFVSAVLLFVAYSIVRLLVTLHRNEFTDTDIEN
jgi:hypothetical protein